MKWFLLAQTKMDDFTSWVLGTIAVAFGGVTSALVVLWKLNESRNTKEIEELRKRIDHLEAELKASHQRERDFLLQIAKLRKPDEF